MVTVWGRYRSWVAVLATYAAGAAWVCGSGLWVPLAAVAAAAWYASGE